VEYKKTPVDQLIPYANNARTHSEEQILKVASSIKEFGFINPVIIDGENGIIAGHCRVESAKRLGMTEVPTLEVKHLSEAQKKAYILADNRLAEDAGWDEELLRIELEGLAELDFDLDSIGFDISELDDIFPDEYDGEADGEIIEPPADPIVKLGDIYLLGRHRLMCGDSTDGNSVNKLMGEGMADMLLTDPPYNVDYEGKTKDRLTITNDSMQDDDFVMLLEGAFGQAVKHMKAGAVFYIWHAGSNGLQFKWAVANVGLVVRQCLIWNKNAIVMGRQDYHWKHEPCLYGWKGGAGHLWASDRKQSTVLEFAKPNANKEHPTMKPLELFQYCMLNNTKGDDIVLDLFGGSGTTLIVAQNTGRVCYMMELDPAYCDVIINRWQTLTGQQAINEATGEVFDLGANKNTPQA